MFKNKQAGVNALHDESSSAEDSDLEERVFLGTLTVEQCSDTNDHTSEINHIQSHRENTKVLTEMQLTASPHHRDTTPIVCKIDTGAEMNVISKRDYEKVVADPKQRQLGPILRISALVSCMYTTRETYEQSLLKSLKSQVLQC